MHPLAVEHSLLFENITVSHIHDGNVSTAIEAAPCDIDQDGLHIRIIKLKPFTYAWGILGKRVACAAAHNSVYHPSLTKH